MKWGALANYFVGVAWKRLSAHEVDPETSRGHEFQGVDALKSLLGTESRTTFATTYMILGDNDPAETIISTGEWYDSREHQSHRAPEWRLYYPSSVQAIQTRMRAGDLLVLALTHGRELVIFLAPANSVREAQLRLLFEIDGLPGDPMRSRNIGPEVAIGFVESEILEELGLASPASETVGDGAVVLAMAEELTTRYPTSLPPGREISALVQDRFADADAIDDPDGTLIRWIEAEDALFRRWEDGLIERRLASGFIGAAGQPDVQAFRDFSMSIRQSRVSRAGGALQLHTSRILRANHIRFAEQAITENGEKPDFLFPGVVEYHDPHFAPSQLRMLAVKFTAKDRWRQVLNEAAKIVPKHLLTMEASISGPQLQSMRAARLQPIVPSAYIRRYPAAYQQMLQPLSSLLSELIELQGVR